MSTYRYRAYNAAGQTVSGTVDAESLFAVEARLREAGIWLLDAREGTAVANEGTSRLTIKRGELINFFVQMSLLLRAGITLPNALDRLAEDFKDTKPGTMLGSLREQVATGVPLTKVVPLPFFWIPTCPVLLMTTSIPAELAAVLCM